MRYFFLILVCLLLANTAPAQQDPAEKRPKLYRIETRDGNTTMGEWVNEQGDSIVLQTASLGRVAILRHNIIRLTELDPENFVKGEYWFSNPHATRYVFGPSAHMLKKGEGYYQNFYLFLQSAHYGVTDHFSIGGGCEILTPLFTQQAPSFFFLTPKFGFTVSPKLKAGGGIFYLNTRSSFSTSSRDHLGIAYGMVTAGSANNNITAGAGWGFRSQKQQYIEPVENARSFHIASRPTFMLGGMLRPAKRLALVTENWFVPGLNWENGKKNYGGVLSGGLRFMGEKMAVDFGVFTYSEILKEAFIAIPYIDFVVKFGGNKRR